MKKQVPMEVRKPSLRNIGGITLPVVARPPIDEEAMNAFIMKPPPGEALFAAPVTAATSSPQDGAPSLLRAQRKDTPRRRADQSAAGEHPTERLTVLLDAETAQALRVSCSTKRMSLSHAVQQAVAQYLATL